MSPARLSPTISLLIPGGVQRLVPPNAGESRHADHLEFCGGRRRKRVQLFVRHVLGPERTHVGQLLVRVVELQRAGPGLPVGHALDRDLHQAARSVSARYETVVPEQVQIAHRRRVAAQSIHTDPRSAWPTEARPRAWRSTGRGPPSTTRSPASAWTCPSCWAPPALPSRPDRRDWSRKRLKLASRTRRITGVSPGSWCRPSATVAPSAARMPPMLCGGPPRGRSGRRERGTRWCALL